MLSRNMVDVMEFAAIFSFGQTGLGPRYIDRVSGWMGFSYPEVVLGSDL